MTLMIDAKRSNQKWTFWLLLILVTIYLTLTLHWIVKNQQQHHKLQTTLDLLPLLLPVQQLSQQIQAERGMLSGFATRQLSVRPPIELQQLQTDAAWRDLAVLLENNQTLTLAAADYLQSMPKQQVLFLLRQQIFDQQLSSTEVKMAYTGILQSLLDLAGYLQNKNELAALATPLSAIVALTEALERAGQERATLFIAFTEQQMAASRYQTYVIQVNEQTDYLQQFANLSPPELQQQWLMTQSQFENGAFIELREQALAQQFDGDVTLWFSLATARIDKIYLYRTQLCQQLLQLAHTMHQQLEKTHQQFIAQLQSLMLVFLLVVWRLYRLHYAVSPLLKQIRHSPQF